MKTVVFKCLKSKELILVRVFSPFQRKLYVYLSKGSEPLIWTGTSYSVKGEPVYMISFSEHALLNLKNFTHTLYNF